MSSRDARARRPATAIPDGVTYEIGYVVPHGLALVTLDRADIGTYRYWEPNVWMIHPELP
jgi:hypothetical protein